MGSISCFSFFSWKCGTGYGLAWFGLASGQSSNSTGSIIQVSMLLSNMSSYSASTFQSAFWSSSSRWVLPYTFLSKSAGAYLISRIPWILSSSDVTMSCIGNRSFLNGLGIVPSNQLLSCMGTVALSHLMRFLLNSRSRRMPSIRPCWIIILYILKLDFLSSTYSTTQCFFAICTFLWWWMNRPWLPKWHWMFSSGATLKGMSCRMLATGKDQIFLQNKETILSWSLSRIRKNRGTSASDPSDPKTGPNNPPR